MWVCKTVSLGDFPGGAVVKNPPVRKTDELIKVLTKDQDEKKINYMGLSELMRMSIIFVTFCLN